MNKHNDKIMQKAKLNLKGLFDLLGKACCGILLSIVTLNTFAQAGIKVTFYHNDILGSPVAATDENGNLLWRQQYRPYGSKPDDESSPQGNRIDYTGHRIDNDLGLVYAGARYYDPEIGRFMSTDPMGFQMASVHSFNKYAYANNNPYRYRDPDGNIPVETVWDIANVVMGVASFGANLASGNFVGAAWDFGGIVVDLAATVTPYVPGGAGTALKAKRAADAIGDVAKRGDQLLLETPREVLLRNASDPRLKDAINNLYRPGAKVGSGSTADAVRYERTTGELLSPKGHSQKLIDRRTQLMKLRKDPNLSDSDRRIIHDILKDTQDALGN